MTKAARRKRTRRRSRQATTRNSYGAGNYHSRMHGSEGSWRAGFALHEHAEQEEPAHAKPSREEEIQSVSEAAHAPPRDSLDLCNRRPPNAVPLSAAPTARCRGVGSTSRLKRSITRIPTC